ncbi:MAG: beta-propeller fold lactonase family protein [Planctomycetota bacterium]
MSRLSMLLLCLPIAQAPTDQTTPLRQLGPEGRLITLAKSAATAQIWDTRTGKELASYEVGDGPHEVAISPDGRFAVVANYGGRKPGSSLSVIRLLHMGPPEQPRVIELGAAIRPHGLVFDSNGEHLWLTAEVTGEIWRVELTSGKVIDKVDVGMGAGHMVAILDDEHLFVSHIADGCVTPVTRQADGSWKAGERISTGPGAEGIWVEPGTDHVWVTNRAEDTISLVDAGLGQAYQKIECAGFPIRVAFTHDGRLAVVSCPSTGDVAVYDTETYALLQRIPIGLGAGDDSRTRLFGDKFGESPVPIGMVFADDDYHLFVSCAGADRIAVLDLRLGRVVGSIATDKEPDGIGWYPAPPPQTADIHIDELR